MKPFKTLQEEAEYWDTQSPMDNVPDTAITVHRAPKKTETLTVRFDPDDLTELREQAEKQGIGPTTLVRMWVREHLKHPHVS